MNRLIDRSPRFDSISDIDTDAFDRTTDGPTDGLFTNARSFVRSRVALSHSCIESIASIASIHAGAHLGRYSSYTHTTSIPTILYIHVYYHQSTHTRPRRVDGLARSGLDCVGTAEGDSLMSPDPYTCVSLHARDPRPNACPRGTAGRRASHTRSHGRLGVEHRIDPARGETRARAEARRRSRRRRPQGTCHARTRFKRARERETRDRTRDRSRDRARIEIAPSSPTTTARGDDG